jgi:transposase-like protein
MTKKTRKKYPEEVKAKAVADYVSGAKSAKQIAQELGLEVHVIYGWRAAADDKKRNQGLLGLQMEGFSPEAELHNCKWVLLNTNTTPFKLVPIFARSERY